MAECVGNVERAAISAEIQISRIRSLQLGEAGLSTGTLTKGVIFHSLSYPDSLSICTITLTHKRLSKAADLSRWL